uniref:Zinc finger PHD-type domain-containing protein n=1 Tax=Anopheles epiroticus TaxID=199890 RepID=A0A182PI34_9DIPT
MLGSPVEVRYDDGDSVVLIQADSGSPTCNSNGVGAADTQPKACGSSGEGNGNGAGSEGGVGGSGGSGGAICASGTGESGRRIIIHDTHRTAGGGSITILTPTNNLKISINKKRRYPGRAHEFQNAKRVLTHDLRHKLGELDKLLKACDNDEDDDDDEPEDAMLGTSRMGNVTPKTSPPPAPVLTNGNGIRLSTSKTGSPPAPTDTTGNGLCDFTVKTSPPFHAEHTNSYGMGHSSLKTVPSAPPESTNGNDSGNLTAKTPPPPSSVRKDASAKTNDYTMMAEVGSTSGDNEYDIVAPRMEEEEARLNPCEDVLVQLSNKNQYYLGTVIEIHRERSCVVRFEDQTTLRVELSNVTPMNGKTYMVARETSGQSQHPQSSAQENDTTGPTNGHNDTTPLQTPSPSEPPRSLVIPDGFSPLTSATQLPYELATLCWDSNHRKNTAGAYCYCGEDGDWMREMIQCWRCEQWFHGRCVRSLQFPIFTADMHYLFICSICNHGHEFVRRLELSTVNLLHLVLFNLIMRNGCRLYDFRLAILPYIEDNQRTLQLPESFIRLSWFDKCEHVQQVLRNNPDRFVGGKELSLPAQLWTLRKAVAPPAPTITIPFGPEETVTEYRLRQLPDTTPMCRFLPRTNHEKNYFMDGVSRERMLGLSYAERPISVEDPRINIGELIVPMNLPAASTSSVCTVNALPPESTEISNDATVPLAGNSQQLTTAAAAATPTTSSSERLLGAAKRKRRGVQLIPPILLPMSDGLDAIFPQLVNFEGPNNPFYGNEPTVPSMRHRGRKGAMLKRRLGDGQRNGGPPFKRQQLDSLQGREPAGPARTQQFFKETTSSSSSSTTTSISTPANTHKLPMIDEMAVLSELSVRNLQRHNSEHGSNSVVLFPRRGSRTYSTSSTESEQIGAPGSTIMGSVASDISSVEDKPLASGRRSSGRLGALGKKNYSDTKRYNRRHSLETAVDGLLAVSGGKKRTASMSEIGDNAEVPQRPTSGQASFTSNSSCEVSGVFCDPTAVKQAVTIEKKSRQLFVVVGRRVTPNGEKELLLEEQ